jgi:hypothetical protein
MTVRSFFEGMGLKSEPVRLCIVRVTVGKVWGMGEGGLVRVMRER